MDGAVVWLCGRGGLCLLGVGGNVWCRSLVESGGMHGVGAAEVRYHGSDANLVLPLKGTPYERFRGTLRVIKGNTRPYSSCVKGGECDLKAIRREYGMNATVQGLFDIACVSIFVTMSVAV